MGLDMYLYAEKHIGSYDYVTGSDNKLSRRDNLDYDKIIEASKMNTLPTAEYATVSVRKMVGYWRKANAIHGWFVRECANGVDECQDIYVTRDKLIELRDECSKALANRHNATPNQEADRVINLQENGDPNEVITHIMDEFKKQSSNVKSNTIVAEPLAPTEGFFFGSTERDEYYYESIEYTLDMLNSLLANNESYEYYYRASW